MNIVPEIRIVALPLSRGKVTLIDAADFEKVGRFKWTFATAGYACRSIRRSDNSKQMVLLHRVLMDAKPEQDIDHINHDGLDNRRSNLRLCSTSENLRNARAKRNGVSKYKGVCWDKSRSCWKSEIRITHKRKYIGRFCSEEEAAKAYDKAARFYFGEFAYLNFPMEDE